MQLHNREGVGWREEEKQIKRLRKRWRTTVFSKKRKKVGWKGSERGRDGRHQKEEGERDWWWIWLSSLPAEALDLRHCGRLQDFQPNYRCGSVENASHYSHSSV